MWRGKECPCWQVDAFWDRPWWDWDPFSSDEYPEETENNEVCIDEDDEEDSDGDSSFDDN